MTSLHKTDRQTEGNENPSGNPFVEVMPVAVLALPSLWARV
jgi:hypothetical protein